MYRVMIVEDDMPIRYFYRMLKTWSDCGFTIAAEETDGQRALDHLEKEQFDLVFTDIRMPFLDGVELLKKLRERGDSTPVVFASSYSDFQYAQAGIVNGLSDYLLKPVQEDKLREVLLRIKRNLDAQNQARIDPVVSAVLEELGVSAQQDNFVKQIAAYCTAHYKEDLSTDDLAEYLNLRKDYFGKLFKQHLGGVSYNDFRARVKIGYAIELLSTGKYKAYEVSDILGYPSYKYFSEKFKRLTGVAPLDYKFGTPRK